MTNAKSYNINLFNKLSLSSFLHLLISLHLSSNNSHCNSHSLHAACLLPHMHIVNCLIWTETSQSQQLLSSLCEILDQPKQKEQHIAIPECGRERCGNIFTTRPATYLLHVLLRATYLQVLLSMSIPSYPCVNRIIFHHHAGPVHCKVHILLEVGRALDPQTCWMHLFSFSVLMDWLLENFLDKSERTKTTFNQTKNHIFF